MCLWGCAVQQPASSSKDFLTLTLVSRVYEISLCEAQVPLFPSVVHFPAWQGWEGGAKGAAVQLHNMLLTYVMKFLLRLVQ